MVAILRIWNPTPNSDVFYKLSPDCHKPSFHAKSWKGRVRKNSHIDINISVKVDSDDERSGSTFSNSESPVLSLAQLCRVQFLLEMNEYTSRWRTNKCNLVVKVELHSLTRGIMLKLQNETKLDVDDPSSSSDHIQQLISKYAEEIPLSNVAVPEEKKAYSHFAAQCEQFDLSVKEEEAIRESHFPTCKHSDLQAVNQIKEFSDNINKIDQEQNGPVGGKEQRTAALLILFMMFLELFLQLLLTSVSCLKQFALKVVGRFLPKQWILSDGDQLRE